MDINELLDAHQSAVMQASASGDRQGRDNHFAKVAEYADRTRELREMRKMTDTTKAADAPQTIIYGTYAGELPLPAAAEAVADWEGEGGVLDPPMRMALPEGITETVVRQYHVGPYVFQDLGLAVAEHMRQLSAETGDG